jgi:hypothetical protein
MSLIKKIDVEAHFAARRAMRNWIKSAGKSKKVLAPAGALSLGHSSPGVSPASIPPAPDSRPNSLLRPPGSRRQW